MRLLVRLRGQMIQLNPWVRRILAVAIIAAIAIGYAAILRMIGAQGAPNASICPALVPTEAEALRTRDAALTKPRLDAAQIAAAHEAYADACLRRWSYGLESSKESVDIVAKAAIQACTPALAAWSTAGGSIDPVATDRAKFYVVQARAGRCRAADDH